MVIYFIFIVLTINVLEYGLWEPHQRNLKTAQHSKWHSLKSVANLYAVEEDPSAQSIRNLHKKNVRNLGAYCINIVTKNYH